MTRVGDVAAAIDAGLRAAGRPERAEQERRYLRSEMDHYGTSVPVIRTTTRRVARGWEVDEHDEVLAVAADLWERNVHECRMSAVELLVFRVDNLTAADLDPVELLLREARTWALVDPLAINVVGDLQQRSPAQVDVVLDRWAADGDFWIRRSALLALLPGLRAGTGDFPRFARYADTMLDEREFFIRKAIGWVLREAGRRRPDDVSDWLAPRVDRVSSVTLREAVKYLPAETRDELLARRQ